MFVRGVPNHRIDDESLKEYFYIGQDDNNNSVLYTIVSGSYGKCTYAEIKKKLENISRNNKAWRTSKLDIGRNTSMVQAINNPTIDEIPDDMAQMTTELGLFLKQVSGGAKKVNAVNYLTKPPLLVHEYYYEEDAYVVNDQMRGFQPNARGSNQENW